MYKSTLNYLNLGKGQFGRKLEIQPDLLPGTGFDLAYRICYLPVERKCLIQFSCVVRYSNLGGQFWTQVEYTEAHKVLLWSLFSKVHLMSKCLETDQNDVS